MQNLFTLYNERKFYSLHTGEGVLAGIKNVKAISPIRLARDIKRYMGSELITIRRLNTPELIEAACALLHDEYIKRQNWQFSPDNPSKLRIEIREDKELLVDRFADQAIWFGAFDNDTLVGCVRLCGVDESNQLEIEAYPSSQPILAYIPMSDKELCYEISKLVTKRSYVGKGIVKRLLLACFRFCQENQFHVLAATSNGYIKSLFTKIGFPLKKEFAFKYEPQDATAVNFYFANYKNAEVQETKKKLEYLENDLSNNAERIFKALQTVEPILPTPFYWMSPDGVVLGINDICLTAIGTSREIIGKKPYSFYKPEIAEHILKHNAEVMYKETILAQEEWIEDVTTKEKKCFSSVKAPLYDDEGTIIGIVGTSIEITAQKEAEQLRLETQHQQVALEEQSKFKTLADKVAHDIRSPLATVLMVIKGSTTMPEKQRIALRDAADTIGDIANNLLSNYHKKESDVNEKAEEREPILASPVLQQILTEKKYQYANLPVKLDHQFSEEGNFSWIEINPTVLKRMLSNIINNAVDAFEQQEGHVTLHLDTHHNKVMITIEDNGKGMPPELVQKIMSHQAVTEGKKEGHGIGLTQVREALMDNHGHLTIDSQVGIGTKITLSFPRAPAGDWIAENIQINDDDTIVILDDDTSIHHAWETRFDTILKEYPQLTVKHFSMGQETIDFINALPPEKKQKVFLLTDYELLNQNINGVSVIKETQTDRAVLVTSHYANKAVRQSIDKFNARILPKQLASDVSITISQARPPEHALDTHKLLKKVDAIFVDDDRGILNGFTFFSHGKEVDTYHDPQQFLNNVPSYDRQTNIILDYHFDGFHLEGVQIAERLHSLGFKRLYLLSGISTSELEVPHYLTLIFKTDLHKVSAILNDN